MFLFKRKTEEKPAWPPERFEPVIRSSICTGERVACMRERDTGKLHELVLIRSEADLDRFCRDYGVSKEKLRTVY